MRLTPDHWLDAGFDALVAKGAHALAAEPLARQIGSTKGSFYWHFKDVPAFHAAVLRHWQADALAAVVEVLQSQAGPDQALRDFGRGILGDPVETALRSWALSFAPAKAALQEVDAERLACITRLLTRLDLPNPDFAHALMGALIGLGQMQVNDPKRAYDTLIDTVLALR